MEVQAPQQSAARNEDVESMDTQHGIQACNAYNQEVCGLGHKRYGITAMNRCISSDLEMSGGDCPWDGRWRG